MNTVKSKKNCFRDLCIYTTFAHNRITDNNWIIDEVKSAYHNLIFVYEGKGEFFNGKEKIVVGEGDLVYFPIGEVKKMTTDKNNPLKMYTVNFAAAYPYIENDELKIKEAQFDFPFVKKITEVKRYMFVSLFERLCRQFLSGEDMQKFKLKETMIEILELTELYNENRTVDYSNRIKVNKAVKYILEHFEEKLTLDELASEAGMSSSHFSAVFRELIGESPIDYLLNVRITKAKQLLCDGVSVTKVSELAGFSDIYYFSSVFKKKEGESPAEFKRRSSCIEVIERIKEYINENYKDINLSISSVGEFFGVDAKQLSKQYSNITGEKMIDAINKRRIEQAKVFLKEDSVLSVESIAERSGFGTSRNFIRVFKKHEGITPGQFRNSFE